MRCEYQVLPEFTVTQHKRDIDVLYALKPYFGCGVVHVNHGDRYCYRVRGISHLQNIIVPFFETHTLLTSKRVDFEQFRTVLCMMEQKQHLNHQGLEQIRQIQKSIKTKK